MNIVAIRLAAEEVVQDALDDAFGAEKYRELPYSYDLARNDERHLAAGYAVTMGDADPVRTQDQTIGFEQDLNVDVTTRVFARNDDERAEEKADELLLACGPIIKTFVNDRLGIKTTVHQCGMRALRGPKFVGDSRDFIFVRMEFRVRYSLP